MSGFNYVMLALGGVAILAFVLLARTLGRRVRGQGGFEAPDPRPEAQSPHEPAAAPAPSAPATPYLGWRLMSRELANPDSAGGPLYRLRLEPEEALPGWRAGAVARIYCGPATDVLNDSPNEASPVGDYMVGSLPTEGEIELVVRLRQGAEPGEGRRSRWLCQDLQPGQQVALALNDDLGFPPPHDATPMILIGNATGLAGLLAQIKARGDGSRNWLIFGDRNSAGDRDLAAELSEWVASGHLERCDLVFPGEGNEQRHVTDQIEDAATPLLDWVLAGAAIYVCGSHLMGDDVHAALIGLMGEEVVEDLNRDGRYRRALY